MPYTPLPAGAVAVNGTDIWGEEDYTLPMPFSWTLDSTIVLNSVTVALGFPGFVNTGLTSGNSITGFIPAFADLIDRGTLAGTDSHSPIRYFTAGAAPIAYLT